MNRTGKQCRERFKNNLSPKLNKGDWTPAEDRIVIEMTKVLGNHWTRIANLLPGRSGIKQIIQYYNAPASFFLFSFIYHIRQCRQKSLAFDREICGKG